MAKYIAKIIGLCIHEKLESIRPKIKSVCHDRFGFALNIFY